MNGCDDMAMEITAGEPWAEADERWARWWGARFSWAARCYHWISLEDLEQAARIGILCARTAYSPDRGAWATWSAYFIQRELRRLVGRGPGGSLPPVALSLDEPITEDTETTLGDMIPDGAPPVGEALEAAERSIVLAAAVDRLGKLEREAVIRVYLGGERQTAAAEGMGVSTPAFRCILERGKRQLRRDRMLRAFCEERPSPTYSTGLQAFRETGLSAPERAVIWKDQHRRQMEAQRQRVAGEVYSDAVRSSVVEEKEQTRNKPVSGPPGPSVSQATGTPTGAAGGLLEAAGGQKVHAMP